MQHSRFDGAKLAETNFREARASDASWRGVNLDGVDFESAVLRGSQFLRGATGPSTAKSASFQMADLYQADFANVNLRNTDFSRANLAEARFSDAELAGARFDDADIRSASFGRNVDFSIDQLYSTENGKARNLQGIELDVDLSGADFAGWTLSGAWLGVLNEANLQNADLSFARVASSVDANLGDAIITGAHINELTAQQLYSTASYKQKNLQGIRLPVFEGKSLEGWSFRDQDLSGAQVSDCALGWPGNEAPHSFRGTDFSGAKVAGAIFVGATGGGFQKEQLYSTSSYVTGHLEGIRLGMNDLQGWDFSAQNLTGSAFSELRSLTDLFCWSANLANANLSGANLLGAELERVELSQANLREIRPRFVCDVERRRLERRRTVQPGGCDSCIAGRRLRSRCTCSHAPHARANVAAVARDGRMWSDHAVQKPQRIRDGDLCCFRCFGY